MTTDDKFAAIERWHGAHIAPAIREAILRHGGHAIGSIAFYAEDEIVERNQTYETQTYCPGYLTIGDDGGGRAIVVHGALDPPTVFAVEHGSMSESDFVAVGGELSRWIDDGCPLD